MVLMVRTIDHLAYGMMKHGKNVQLLLICQRKPLGSRTVSLDMIKSPVRYPMVPLLVKNQEYRLRKKMHAWV